MNEKSKVEQEQEKEKPPLDTKHILAKTTCTNCNDWFCHNCLRM